MQMCASFGVDGAAALVAAAVRAAVLAKAPRRTVSAVAASVVSALGRPAAATQRPAAQVPTGAQRAAAASFAESAGGPSPEELLAALRSARAAQRRRKKQRRKAAKMAGAESKQEEEATEQPQEPSRGGDLVPSLPAAGAMPVPMEVEAVEANGHRNTNRLSDASPPHKQPRLESSAEDEEYARSSHTAFTDDLRSTHTV